MTPKIKLASTKVPAPPDKALVTHICQVPFPVLALLFTLQKSKLKSLVLKLPVKGAVPEFKDKGEFICVITVFVKFAPVYVP